MVFKLESNRLAVCFMFNNRSSRNTGGAPRGLSSVLAHVGSFLISTHRRFFPLFVYSVLLLIFGFSMDRCLSGLKASPPRRARDLSFSNDANVSRLVLRRQLFFPRTSAHLYDNFSSATFSRSHTLCRVLGRARQKQRCQPYWDRPTYITTDPIIKRH